MALDTLDVEHVRLAFTSAKFDDSTRVLLLLGQLATLDSGH